MVMQIGAPSVMKRAYTEYKLPNADASKEALASSAVNRKAANCSLGTGFLRDG
jgi:hypothetical protein